jgi:hypothetical protein
VPKPSVELEAPSLRPYYTYVLADPRHQFPESVFYVGQGSGQRVYDHGDLASRIADEKTDSQRLLKIKEIRGAKEEFQILVVARVYTKDEALLIEAVLINWVYGLANLTNLVRGHGHKFVRRRGKLTEVAHLDVRRRTRNERNGEHKKEQLRRNKLFDVEALLTSYAEQLRARDEDLVVSKFDGENPKLPRIWVTMAYPFRLEIMKRGNPGTLVTFGLKPLNREKQTIVDFESIASRFADGAVKNKGNPEMYYKIHRAKGVKPWNLDEALRCIRLYRELVERSEKAD